MRVAGRSAALSIHADYRCRHSGALLHRRLGRAGGAARLPVARARRANRGACTRRPQSGGTAIRSSSSPTFPTTRRAMLERNRRRRVRVLRARVAAVHRAPGPRARRRCPPPAGTSRAWPCTTPAARSSRLSHFCPTAASMLFRDDVPLTIVSQPPAFPPADYEGLIVTAGDLPPLLRPGVLMDLDAYAALGAHMVRRCAGADDAGVGVGDAGARRRACCAGGRRTDRRCARCRRCAADALVRGRGARHAGREPAGHAEAMAAVPDDLRPDAGRSTGSTTAFARLRAPAWGDLVAPLRHYLAAKAFASWTAYQGRGLSTSCAGSRRRWRWCASRRREPVPRCPAAARSPSCCSRPSGRRTSCLNHLAVGEDLASAWSKAERR